MKTPEFPGAKRASASALASTRCSSAGECAMRNSASTVRRIAAN
jgi:hypothetical protein